MQRLRLTYTRGEEVKYLSHLDMVRLWQRALRRATIPLAYSKGFHPQPRLFFAAPLPVGVTGARELLDVLLEEPLLPPEFQQRVAARLPEGVVLLEVAEVDLGLPALPNQVRAAEYEAAIATPKGPEQLQERIAALLAAKELPRQRKRRNQMRPYDLRPLVEKLWLEEAAGGEAFLGMRLRHSRAGVGRPEEVLAALGLGEHPTRLHRRQLILEESFLDKPLGPP